MESIRMEWQQRDFHSSSGRWKHSCLGRMARWSFAHLQSRPLRTGIKPSDAFLIFLDHQIILEYFRIMNHYGPMASHDSSISSWKILKTTESNRTTRVDISGSLRGHGVQKKGAAFNSVIGKISTAQGPWFWGNGVVDTFIINTL